MQQVLTLAELGKYSVSPNPMVAAIIIKDDILIGYGIHFYQGDDHAEVKALKMAKSTAKNAKIYINLEPCCHFGLTPPCSDAIIEAGISEVHFANIDPNPLMQGKSIAILEQAGIKVFVGEMAQQGLELNKIFFHHQQNKLPYIIAKWAMSLDGKISSNTDSKWITNEISRQKSHFLRNSVDAILIGHNSAYLDDPLLNVREITVPRLKIPYKVILTNHFEQLSLNSNIFILNPEKTIIVSKEKISSTNQQILSEKGVQFFNFAAGNQIDLPAMLKQLNNLNISSLMIEGGSYTLSKFLQAQLINYFYCFIGGKIVTGANSKTLFNFDFGIDSVNDAIKLNILKSQQLGNDILIEGEFNV